MNQINFSKLYFHSHKNPRILLSSSSKFKFPLIFPLISTNLKKTNKVIDILMALQKQKEEEKCIHKILESFKSPSQLLQVLEVAANLHPFILHTILSILEYNPSLCPKNTSESLHKFFSRCEENEEEGANMVIFDKAARRGKVCSGFVVAFKNWVDDGGGPRGTRIEDQTAAVVGPIVPCVGDDCGASSS